MLLTRMPCAWWANFDRIARDGNGARHLSDRAADPTAGRTPSCKTGTLTGPVVTQYRSLCIKIGSPGAVLA